MDHVPRWHTWKGNISDQLCEEFPTCKKQCLIIPGDPPSKMSLHPSKTNIEPKDWSLENPWGPEGNLPFHKGEFQDPCQFYSVQDPFPSCHSKVERNLPRYMTPSQFPAVPRVACRQVLLPLSRQTGFNWKQRANQLKSQSVTSLGTGFGFGSRNCPFPVATFTRVRGFQDAIYMIQKPPLLFPSFSFRYSLCIIFQDFQASFLSSRPLKSWGQGKLFGIVHGDVHQWHTIWVPPKHSVVPETWLTQERPHGNGSIVALELQQVPSKPFATPIMCQNCVTVCMCGYIWHFPHCFSIENALWYWSIAPSVDLLSWLLALGFSWSSEG